MVTDVDEPVAFDRTVDRVGACIAALALLGLAALATAAVLTVAGYEPLVVDERYGPDSVVLLCGPRGVELVSAE